MLVTSLNRTSGLLNNLEMEMPVLWCQIQTLISSDLLTLRMDKDLKLTINNDKEMDLLLQAIERTH